MLRYSSGALPSSGRKNCMPDYALIDRCQVCRRTTQEVMSLGDLPLVDQLLPIRPELQHQATYPAPLLYCPGCHLVQIGCIVDHRLLFPKHYPYTSGTTKILRDNFAQLADECVEFFQLTQKDLVVDIGCNDGTLLSNFKGRCRVAGITPEDMGELARQKGIPVVQSYLTPAAVKQILAEHGKAKVVTATNVFAHFEDVHEAVSLILDLLDEGGGFVSESGYVYPLLKELQYDSVHHEHLRYYSLSSLEFLLDLHGLVIVHAKEIPTHGGSIRVYACRSGDHKGFPSVKDLKARENKILDNLLQEFGPKVAAQKKSLRELLSNLKKEGRRIYGIGAPGRATTLIHFTGIDETILDCVLEVPQSHKINKFIPATRIPVLSEERLFKDPPDYALMLSWHIADELMPKIKAKGYRGDFIVPLPKVCVVKNVDLP